MADDQKTNSLNGLYLHGTLLSAEPTKSGKNNDMQWGASVKLNFIAKFTKKMEVKGVFIDSTATRLVTISITTTDDLLPLEVEKYKKLEGQHLSLNLEPQKNSTFKIIE
ncbi:MAG: hypothetical protein Q8N01_06020 [Sulfuricurvum sp.]|nr:hypothetical protein [Sulfuricurvum sp.]